MTKKSQPSPAPSSETLATAPVSELRRLARDCGFRSTVARSAPREDLIAMLERAALAAVKAQALAADLTRSNWAVRWSYERGSLVLSGTRPASGRRPEQNLVMVWTEGRYNYSVSRLDGRKVRNVSALRRELGISAK